MPWHGSPAELALPAPRTDGGIAQVGSNLLYIGGSDGTTAQSTVYVAPTVGVGNFDQWAEGPPLPEPRSDASTIAVSGIVYVIGGRDADGAPTTTVFRLTPDPQTGVLDDWEAVDELVLPEGRAGAAVVSTPDGLLVIGGEGPGGPVATTYKSPLRHGRLPGTLGSRRRRSSRRRPTATRPPSATSSCCGAGTTPTGRWAPSRSATSGSRRPRACPRTRTRASSSSGGPTTASTCRPPRDDAAGWSANGTIYAVGGTDGGAPAERAVLGHPERATRRPSNGSTSSSPTCRPGISGGAAIVTGPNAVIVGGETAEGVVATSVRANTAPQAPFFQLGLVGATVPGLKIEGEIGQQLGYLNAAGAGTVNFVILLLIGWGFAHKEQARGIIRRVLRR